MKTTVIVFPGSNRERDMALALTQAFGSPPDEVWHTATELPPTDLIVIPGGFSYGDYLRAGCMAAQSPVVGAVRNTAARGVAVLGVCNGFQVLCETGLLPGALMRNAGLKFVCKDAHLRVENTNSVFLSGYRAGEVIRVPVAHHDGNYFADTETLDRLEGDGRVAVRYCDTDGNVTEAANPNGSQRNIAGLYNETGNVLGMMPHPEDAINNLTGGTGGMALFYGLAAALSGSGSKPRAGPA